MAEMHVVDNVGSQGFHGSILKVEGDADIVFFRTQRECLYRLALRNLFHLLTVSLPSK